MSAMEITCSSPCERDLDLVLMDLLSSWTQFGQWLGDQLVTGTLQGVAHSVMDADTGESDLELSWEQPGGEKERLLIENKIDAPFQPRQAERYRERGESYVRRGLCSRFRTMLFAPEAYLNQPHGFDHTLSYEAVVNWIDAQTNGHELRMKRALLQAAIQKGKPIYAGIEGEAVTEFWRDCATLVNLLEPQLEIVYVEGARSEKSDVITFRPQGLPKKVGIWLRFPPSKNGYMQLLIPKAAERANEAKELLGQLPSENHWLRPAGQALAIGYDTDPVNIGQPLNTQSDAVLNAIQELDRLRQWGVDHADALSALID